MLDTILCPMDALLRTNAVTSTLSLLYAPNVHHEYVSSPFTHMLLGAIVSAGGGFLVSILGAWNADWAFSTPPVLRYGVVRWLPLYTAPQPFSSFSTYVSLVFSSPLLPRKPHPDFDFPTAENRLPQRCWLSSSVRLALCTHTLVGLFSPQGGGGPQQCE